MCKASLCPIPHPIHPKPRVVPGSGGSQQNLRDLGMNGGRDHGSRTEKKEGRVRSGRAGEGGEGMGRDSVSKPATPCNLKCPLWGFRKGDEFQKSLQPVERRSVFADRMPRVDEGDPLRLDCHTSQFKETFVSIFNHQSGEADELLAQGGIGSERQEHA